MLPFFALYNRQLESSKLMGMVFRSFVTEYDQSFMYYRSLFFPKKDPVDYHLFSCHQNIIRTNLID